MFEKKNLVIKICIQLEKPENMERYKENKKKSRCNFNTLS